jgi:hypothetical protein
MAGCMDLYAGIAALLGTGPPPSRHIAPTGPRTARTLPLT